MDLLIIVGARGLGHELLAQARGDASHDVHWTVLGFLDTGGPEILPPEVDIPVIGDPLIWNPHPRERYLPAIGDPNAKEKFLAPLIEKGAIFMDLRTEVRFGERTTYGAGTVFGRRAVISSDCNIGDYVYIDSDVNVGHDVDIGPYSHIGARAFIGGNTKIGSNVTIHPCASIGRGLNIGDGAVVGMGSVVLRDVAPGMVVMGNPARALGKAAEQVGGLAGVE